MSNPVKIAAVQPALRLGAVEENLVRLEGLIRDAVREHSPAIVTVPEAASSPNVYSKLMHGVARPIDGAPMQLYRQLARELDVVVGGGFLARRGNHVYGTYVLAEPDGRVHLHDKDIPTMWEHNYYTGGADPGRSTLAALDGAPVGIANGWEWARMGTARRLRGQVQLLLGGMCWPSYPENWRGPFAALASRERALQRQHARELPRQMARLIGAPVVMPSHVGPVDFETPLVPGLAWRTTMLGETQIVERDGTVLARLTQEDGEAHVAATVHLADPRPADPLGPMFWIPPLSVTTRAAWTATNTHGAIKYRAMRTLHRHPWQSWPGGDLPDEIGPGEPLDQQQATTADTRRPPMDIAHIEQTPIVKAMMGRLLKVHQFIYERSSGRVGHKALGVPCLLLRTTGARTGQLRTNSLIYGRDGDSYVVVASASGAPKAPGWYHNLRAKPSAEIQIGTGTQSATASVVTQRDPDYDRLWKLMNDVNLNRYNAYQEVAGRPIPIVKLTPVG